MTEVSGTRVTLVSERSKVIVWCVSSAYVAVSIVSAVWALRSVYAGVDWAVTAVLLAAQLVFLVPPLRHHLHAVAGWSVVGLAGLAAGIALLYVGSYFVAGLASGSPSSLPDLLWMAAALTWVCAPALAVATGSVVVGLAAATPPLWKTATGVGLAMIGIIASAFLISFTLAP